MPRELLDRDTDFGRGFTAGAIAAAASTQLVAIGQAYRDVVLPVLGWLISVLLVVLVLLFAYGFVTGRVRARTRS